MIGSVFNSALKNLSRRYLDWLRPGSSRCARYAPAVFCLFMLPLSQGAFAVDIKPEMKIDGEWIQGALLQGKTLPGTKVQFLDNEVFVNEQGEFILGLGRDTPTPVEVIAVFAGQAEPKRYVYAVTQRSYDIQRVDGVEQKYVEPSAEDMKRIEQDNIALGHARRLREARADFAEGFIWPLVGPISGVYGSQRIFNGVPKQPHFGLDIAAPTGTLVKAPAGGKVTLAKDLYYSGWTLLIDHGQGLSSAFLHLNQVLVKEGVVVKQGDVIAEVGATGRVTGAHLDWRMNWLDQRLDVQLLLPPAGE
jgi:murein DD-endopeptidase MepM/ murein hydrolase activator NlpD